MSVCPIIGDVTFDHLNEVVSIIFSILKETPPICI